MNDKLKKITKDIAIFMGFVLWNDIYRILVSRSLIIE